MAASRAYHRQIRQGTIPDTRIPAGPPPPGPWVDQAACRGSDVEAFFPTKGANVGHLRLICAACPVQSECLAWAVESFSDHTDFGFYGGRSPRERRNLRRQAGHTRPAEWLWVIPLVLFIVVGLRLLGLAL